MNVYFVDPQSSANLALYDHGVFSNLEDIDIKFWCSIDYSFNENSNIRIIKCFNYNKKNSSVRKALSYSKSMLKLFFNALFYRPKVIHIQWLKLFWLDFFVYLIISKIAGSKIIFTAHNSVPHEATKSDFSRFKKWYKICHKVIAHTETSRADLINQFNVNSSKVVVIPHGYIDIPSQTESLDKEIKHYRNKLGIKPNTLVFGHLGSLSEYKGTDLLIRAWCENETLHNKDIMLLVAGRDSKISIPSSLPKNIKIIRKFLSNDEFKALLQLTDIMVMPYRKIDQSGLLLTLVNERIPFIVSRAGELSNILENSNIGWSLEDIKPTTISNKISHIVKNKSEFFVKKESCDWGKIKKIYDWESISNKTSQLYKSFNI